MPCVLESWVCQDHDNAFAHDAHVPVALSCAGWIRHPHAKAPFRWDDQAMLDPVKCDAFRSALHTLPLPQWSIHPDDHAKLYEQQVLALAQAHFGLKSGRSRKIRLQPATLDAIAFKRHVLDAGRTFGLCADPDFKTTLRSLEKEVARRVAIDVQAFYDTLVADFETAGELANHKLVYRLLQRLGRKKGNRPPGPRPLPMLKK